MMRVNRSIQGFTMIELLVAVVIMSVVTSSALMVFMTQHKTYMGQERVLAVQQDARLVMDIMLADVRMAGFLVPPATAISGRDGGTGGADALCVSDPSIFAEAQITGATAAFQGARLSASMDNGDTQATLVTASMDIDGDGDADFANGAGIIIADGNDTHCARITNVNANVITFTPATPGGFDVSTGTGRVAPAVVYELGGTTLRRNSVLLSTQVENVQVEYAIDSNGNGQIEGGEFPLDTIVGESPARVRGIRLHVIARSPLEDEDYRGNGLPAAANHTGGAADGFKRRRFTSNAVLRNLL